VDLGTNCFAEETAAGSTVVDFSKSWGIPWHDSLGVKQRDKLLLIIIHSPSLDEGYPSVVEWVWGCGGARIVVNIYTYSKVKDKQILDKNWAYVFFLFIVEYFEVWKCQICLLIMLFMFLDTSIQLLVKLVFSRPPTRVRTVQFQLYSLPCSHELN
jgi:hypothetical protein